jgi:hypothetical protein
LTKKNKCSIIISRKHGWLGPFLAITSGDDILERDMNTGMLWFDNDPKADFLVKINRATEYYLKKYGQKPDLCYVNPGMKFEPPPKTIGIDVQTDHMILPDHFWLGVKRITIPG